jgi:hypothetical protein
MVWVKVDDGLFSHPKFAALGELMLPAAGLYVLALSWSGHELTDGFIPTAQVARLAGRKVSPIVRALVAAGLWDVVEGGYRIHDFLEYNPSRAEALAARAERREVKARSGALGGQRSVEVRRELYGTAQPPRRTGASFEAASEAGPEASAEAAPRLHRTPVPVPVPERENSLMSRRGDLGAARLALRDFG